MNQPHDDHATPAHAKSRDANSHRLLEHAKARRGLLDTVPETITITGSYACNYRCIMCNLPHGEGASMAEALIPEVIRVLPQAQLLRLAGGEPLLFPPAARLLQAAKAAGTRTTTFTNGALLDRCAFDPAELLDEVIISLDAATPVTYRAIRGHDLAPVLRNAARLIEAKAKRGTGPDVLFNFVAMRRNIEELEPLVRLAADLGAKAVGCVFLRVQHRELLDDSLYFHQERSDACMVRARETAARLGIALQLPLLFSQAPPAPENASARHRHCLEPWKYLEISPYDQASLCCAGGGSEKIAPGSTLEALWNTPAKQALRETVNTPAEPDCCKACGFGSVMHPGNPGAHFVVPAILHEALSRKPPADDGPAKDI